ncbi:hypothetical protein A5893_06590 [Pedobacter psychrophilus]|uniref:Transglutaminase-like domain-containing protein n=1 Tax=Pedobacter psychrophilus TaxID=1826909 RepID=A0A179DKG3_9SPHI|nr:hypothetical protein A5893_06590 [Pedobacter psychrophilus]
MVSFICFSNRPVYAQNIAFQFYDETFNIKIDSALNIPFNDSLTQESVIKFYQAASKQDFEPIINKLISYKNKEKLNDWFYYQLVRKTVQQISPKEVNYERYTLYKWFFLLKSGYDTRLAVGKNQLLFYVWSDDDISDIPFYKDGKKQLVCLNFHDYPNADYQKDKLYPVAIELLENNVMFSYKVTQIPDFKTEDYQDKTLQFDYKQRNYHFNIKLNNEVQTLFKNYPVVDFESYFNIPLSRETYQSIIPYLKRNLKGLSQRKGVDYLMRFTRNAFLYESDQENFGKEKRLSPEQTLFNNYSDCDDRAALFFYLVKEIYNLPMIALLYPTHITMAVNFDKAIGNPIFYKGQNYYVCEPTPQKKDLKLGQQNPLLSKVEYQVVYQYLPIGNKN